MGRKAIKTSGPTTGAAPDLADELRAAEARLDELRRDRDELPARYRAAAEAGDVEAMTRLGTQRAGAEAAIEAARIRVLSLRRDALAAELERERERGRAECQTLRAEADRLAAELESAEAAYRALIEPAGVARVKAEAAAFTTQDRIDRLRERISDANTELRELIAEATGETGRAETAEAETREVIIRNPAMRPPAAPPSQERGRDRTVFILGDRENPY